MTTTPDGATESLPTLRGSIPPVREWAKTFLIGLCMGAADGVPGVSGGTIALIAGIYERLIAAVTAVTPERAVALLRALTPVDGGVSGRRALAILEEFDVWFLAALLVGIVTAVVAVTRVIHVANQETPALLFGFFFGLIAASAVILLRALDVENGLQVVAGVVGVVVAFLLSGPVSFLDGGGLLVVFVAGAVGVSAMILPGISGSLLLVILGQYTRMSTTLSEFVDSLAALVTGGAVARVVESGTVVVTFVLGGLVGLFTISRVVRRALDRNRRATLAFLVGLVVGALRAPVQRVAEDPGFSQDVLLAFAGAAVVGALVLLALEWYAVDLDLDSV
jgi:putative membrane protein